MYNVGKNFVGVLLLATVICIEVHCSSENEKPNCEGKCNSENAATSEIKRSGYATIRWDADKASKVMGEVFLNTGGDKSFKGKFIADPPNEQIKHLDMIVNSKLTENLMETNGVLKVNAERVSLDSRIGVNYHSLPLINITMVHPSGKSKLYVNFETLTRDQIKGQIIIEYPFFGGWEINANIDAQLGIDNPKLRADIDAPKLKIDKWRIEADQRSAKGANNFVLSVKSRDKTVVAGSTTLQYKQNVNLKTYSGAGNNENKNHRSKRYNSLSLVQRASNIMVFDGDYSMEYKTPKGENLKISVKVDSKPLDEHWKSEAELNAKEAKNIVFSVKSHDQIVVAGSTTLRYKQDANSETYGYGGVIELGDDGTKKFEINLSNEQLTQNSINEIGNEYKFKVDAGENSLRSSMKSTNRGVSGSVKYCSKNLCSNGAASTKLVTGDLNRLIHDTMISIDINHLEVPVSMYLREHAEQRGWLLNHADDVRLPYSNHRAARALVPDSSLVVNVTLPKRVLSFEALSSATLGSSVGEQELALQIWSDRENNPSQKAGATIVYSTT